MNKDWAKSTLGERVRYAVKESGKKSQNAVAKEIGIESGPMSRIANDKTRFGDPENDKVRRSPTILADIARVCRVSLRWLTTGEGQPEDASPVAPAEVERPTDRYPSRPAAAEALRGTVSEAAIKAMLAEQSMGLDDKDPGSGYWFERGMWWEGEIRKGRNRLTAPSLDEPAPMQPRPKRRRG